MVLMAPIKAQTLWLRAECELNVVQKKIASFGVGSNFLKSLVKLILDL